MDSADCKVGDSYHLDMKGESRFFGGEEFAFGLGSPEEETRRATEWWEKG